MPYPANYGGVIDVFYKVKALADLGIKIHLHCYEYGRKPAKALADICETVHYYPRKISKRYLFSAKPYIVVTRNNNQLIANLLSNHHPILFEGLHCTYYLDHPDLKKRVKIVRTHNIEHDYYQNLAQAEKNVFKRYYFYTEAQKLQAYESVLKHANIIAAISPNDKAYLESKYRHVQYVPAFHPNNVVDLPTGKGKFALYHGSLEVAENNQAALFLVQKVFSKIDVPLIIAGNKPSLELREAAAQLPNITIKDNITTAEIHTLIAQAQVNVLPTFQATGIKLKLLAALYMGRHCLVNTPMVENTGLESLCSVANTPAEFQKALVALMKKDFTPDYASPRQQLLETTFSNTANAQRLAERIFKPVGSKTTKV